MNIAVDTKTQVVTQWGSEFPLMSGCNLVCLTSEQEAKIKTLIGAQGDIHFDGVEFSFVKTVKLESLFYQKQALINAIKDEVTAGKLGQVFAATLIDLVRAL